ncbi:hypothetical protein [Mesorhizobium sp. B2-3-15]|uniref:hypothetical protein n=1 Tax=Mesorhizobium sp. B2-3-15 TaxID=2589949 RepID=UPI00112EA87E|nr:hypothetical protein [Mesorhizobium sp. B2-3-15]TPL75120.1 hypothetical protein FJ954_09190 [Mesorhizobium sp. B2-3-15]
MVGKSWPVPPEYAALVGDSRKGFRAQFGSFDEAQISAYALGTSEDGGHLAFQFIMPDGSVHRFTLRSEWVPQFVIELAGATDDMNERRVAAALVAAEPKGQA